MEKVDDPDVFNFDVSEGKAEGISINVNQVPSGNAFVERPEFHSIYKDLYPAPVHIMFKPKLNILYKCKYKIFVKGGVSVEFFLKGRGSYEEKDKQIF